MADDIDENAYPKLVGETGWEPYRVNEIDKIDQVYMSEELEDKAVEYAKKGNLFLVNGFYIFMLPRSIRIVGYRDDFDDPTTNMRTHDFRKAMAWLKTKFGGWGL